MEFLFGLLDNPLVLGAAGIALVLFAYRFVADRVRLRVPGSSLTAEGMANQLLGGRWADKKREREVARLRRSGNHLAAGKLLEDVGQLAAAAEAYLEGQEYWAAAASYEKLGRTERAAELYLQAGDYKKGAALFTTAGKPARAAALFLEKGNNLEAARLFALAGQWATAAELYEKSGYPLRAAEAWEKDGKPLKAAEAYEKHFTENVSYSTTLLRDGPGGGPEERLARGPALRAGRASSTARRRCTSKGGYHREAAEALLQLGQPAKAAELFLRGEDEERAAAAFDAGRRDRHARRCCAARRRSRRDRPAEAAAWFVKGRDFLRAAELYESVGMMRRGRRGLRGRGELGGRGRRLPAGRARRTRAATAYEKAGELETAAALFEELGDRPARGRAVRRAGLSRSRAARPRRWQASASRRSPLLQRVPPADERLPRGDGAAGAALHRDGPAGAGDRAPAQGDRRRGDVARGTSTSSTGSPSPRRPPARVPRRSRSTSRSRRRTCSSATWPAHGAARRPGGPRDGPRQVAPERRRRPLRPAARRRRRAPPLPRPPRPPAAAARRRAGGGARRGARPALRAARGDRARPARRRPPRRGHDGRPQRRDAHHPARARSPAPGCSPALAADLKAAAQLSHPNLVKVIAFMELEGRALRRHRARRRAATSPRRSRRGRRLGLPAGARARPDRGAGPGAAAREGPRARLGPAVERHGRHGVIKIADLGPRPPGARARPGRLLPRAGGRAHARGRPLRARAPSCTTC